MHRAFLFALDPTPEQEQMFRSHCGAVRYAYNWAVEHLQKVRAQRAAEHTYGLRGPELTPGSAWDARVTWNAVKYEIAPWWEENSRWAYGSGIDAAHQAWKVHSDSLSGRRKGKVMNRPRFKGRRSRLWCKFMTEFKDAGDCRHVILPKLGRIRTHESTRKLVRQIRQGKVKVRSATLSYQRGRWHVSFTAEILSPKGSSPAVAGSIVGVDLGLKSLAVLSTGEVVPNTRPLHSVQKVERRLHRRMTRRRGPSLSRGLPASRRWQKANRRFARFHAAVAARRRDGLHKLTTRVAESYSTVVVENLNVANLRKNPFIGKSVNDVGWGELRRQLAYKTERVGNRLMVADRWFPSSKTCSACGAVRAKLRLSERTFRCHECGFSLDRDLNAARNLAALATEVASSESCDGTLKKLDGSSHESDVVGSGHSHEKDSEKEPTLHREVVSSTMSRTEACSGELALIAIDEIVTR